MTEQTFDNPDVDYDENELSEHDNEEEASTPVTINSVLVKLKLNSKYAKSSLDRLGGETLASRVSLARIRVIVGKAAAAALRDKAIFTAPSDDEVKVAYDSVRSTEEKAKASAPKDLATQYRELAQQPPDQAKLTSLANTIKPVYIRFLTTRGQVRTTLGVSDANADQAAVIAVDATDNAKRLAAYLGIRCITLWSGEVNSVRNAILYGHAGYGPLPNAQAGTNSNDPRLGQTQLLTPTEVADLLGDHNAVAVIGCNTQQFALKLKALLGLPSIICATQPYKWNKAGGVYPPFLLAKDESDGTVHGTLADILATK